jgi:hypothetical protein
MQSPRGTDCHTLDLRLRTVQKVRVMKARAGGSRVLLLGGAVMLAGCATMQRTVGGWFGATTPTPTPQVAPAAAEAPRVYYAGNEGMKVYSEASASSKVIGQLLLHEKVTRFKLERGWAYVEGAKSGAKGWVNNAQLIWRLPAAKDTGAAPGAEQAQPEEAQPEQVQPQEAGPPTGEEPAAPEATPAAEEVPPAATPTSAAPPGSQATPRGVAPSIFNPY